MEQKQSIETQKHIREALASFQLDHLVVTNELIQTILEQSFASNTFLRREKCYDTTRNTR